MTKETKSGIAVAVIVAVALVGLGFWMGQESGSEAQKETVVRTSPSDYLFLNNHSSRNYAEEYRKQRELEDSVRGAVKSELRYQENMREAFRISQQP